MPSLRELQLRFGAALFDGSAEPVLPWICSNGIDAESRIGIYRNNVREGFIKTLALEFPVVQRLVGEDYFRQLALRFLADHPSRSGNLYHIGQPFPPFLGRWFENTAYPYVADVAQLEWAYQESLAAADTEPLDPSVLLQFAPEAYPDLRFRLHPGCRLVRSAYPILRIWEVNQQETAAQAIIDLGAGADFVLVRRVAEGAEFHRLALAEFELLVALAEGVTLGDAHDAGCSADPHFDVGAALRHLVALGVLTDPRTSPTRTQ